MKAIRVNADYELELFTGKKAPPLVNQSLEFLAFFVTDETLFTSKKYSESYLGHVEELTGRKPSLSPTSEFYNWWGKLEDIELEKKLNSKEFCLGFTGGKLISDIDQIKLDADTSYLAKNPHGMSGQNIVSFHSRDLSEVRNSIDKYGAVIVEPLLERVYDFSHYVFPDGKLICYENVVDQRFQYKGTLFSDYKNPAVNSLRFHHEISQEAWERFQHETETIIKTYRAAGARDGFSIDSFIYRSSEILHIRAMSEVNYRKTMGLIAWLLSERFAGTCRWTLFLLGKKKEKVSFEQMKKDLQILEKNVLLLSPGDTRFEMFFLKAKDAHEGAEIFRRLKSLLPYTEFAIEL